MSQSKTEDNKNKRFEEYEDSLWKVIMHNFAEHEGKELLKEIEDLKEDPQFQPSDAERKRFKKMLDGERRKQKIRSLTKISKKVLTRVAVVFLILIVGLGVMYTTVDAFRVQVLNFLLTFEKEYTHIRLGDENGNGENITAGFSNTYAPTYIPDGYWIEGITSNPNFKVIDYINNDGKHIKFNILSSSFSANIDTENAEIIRNVKINEIDGIFVFKNELSTISWSNEEKIFVIYAELNEEEILKIAKSVIFIK